MAEEIPGLAEEGRGHAEGQQRPRRGPGQDREIGVEIRLDGRQRHHEDREGDVEGEQPGKQCHQGPPLVAGAADGPPGDTPVQQHEPVRLDGPVRPQRPHGATAGVEFRVEQDVGLLLPRVVHLGHPTCLVQDLPSAGRGAKSAQAA